MMPRPQFTIRTLLVATLVVAVAFAWLGQRRYRIAEEAATTLVLSKGGMIGSDSHGRVTEIVFGGQRGDVDLAANVEDADLDVLRAFPHLQKLDLTGRRITDGAVPQIRRLRKLRILQVAGTQLTDDGIERLRAALPWCSIER